VATNTNLPSFLIDLDDQQREAVEHDGGPCAVLAGPGAGKTRVIIHRLRRLLADPADGGLGADPESVVAIAFTIKSADQLRERLAEALTPGIASRVRASTCHAFGRGLLDRFADTIDLPPVRTISDSAQRRRLMRDIILESGAMADRRAEGVESLVSLALRFVERCQIDAVEPETLIGWCEAQIDEHERGTIETQDEQERDAALARLRRDADLARLYGDFTEQRLGRGLLMLDDFINLPAKILREQPLPGAIVRDEVRHVVVDEFQDWNPAQIEFLAHLVPSGSGGHGGPDLFVVGDDDQSIYAFRGADDRAFERFEKRWPGATTRTLTTNYRSAPIVVETGNVIISEVRSRFAPDKVIEPNPSWGKKESRPSGSLEGVILDNDPDAGVVIGAMIREDRAEREAPYSEYAVIARNQADVDAIANELEIAGIPVDARRKPTPLDDDGVQDALAWMRLIMDPTNRPDAQRLLLRPPMNAEIDEVEGWGRSHRKLSLTMGEEAPGFIEWLRAEHGEHGSVAWLLERYDALRAQAAVGERADRVVESIVRESGVAHAEGLGGRRRADRIESLVRLLRFVRRVTPNLDQPRGLREFWLYYTDLDAQEQQLEIKGESALDRDLDDEGRPDAVTVITAHSAKGLEFDTVFLPKVRARGYPSIDRSDGEDVTLPAELTGRHPTDHADEERRVFYVACTRAERRLVLLAKHKKGKTRGSSGDYYMEVTLDHEELGLREHSGAAWLEKAGADADSTALAISVGEPGDVWLNRRRDSAMQRAVSELHRAARSGLTDDELMAISAELSACALELAALEHWRRTGAAPSLSPPDEAGRQRLEDIASRMSQRDFGADSLTRPMKAPLRLSYSKISDYDACPRCFYAKNVLGLDESKTTHLAVGDIVHTALEGHLKAAALAEAEGEPPPSVEALIARGLDIARFKLPGEDGDLALLQQIEAQLRKAAEQLAADSAAQLLEPEMHVDLPWTIEGDESGRGHVVVAKIDRVDLMPSGAFRIVDYKTGRASKRLTEPDKDDLQLCIYAIALMHKMSLEEVPAGAAEYWVLSTGDRGVLPFADMKLDKARGKIDEVARGMLAGEFEQGKKCKGLCEWLDG